MARGEYPDDGWGYFDEKGRPYSFVGYYVLQNYRGGERGNGNGLGLERQSCRCQAREITLTTVSQKKGV